MRRETDDWVALSIRLAALAFLLYWAFVLLRPFIAVIIWSVVLTVALYPGYQWIVQRIGGRRRLAAALLTIFCLVVVIGPAVWLVLGLIQSAKTLSQHFDVSTLSAPASVASIRTWPLIGEPLYRLWDFTTNNLRAALGEIVSQLKPFTTSLLQIVADASVGTAKFLAAIVVSGFLFPIGPSLGGGVRTLASKLADQRGDHFVEIAESTIRTVARGVVGVSAIQALLAGIGFSVAGIPGASLLTLAVLVFSIVQIGAAVVIVPVLVWAWATMATSSATAFTAYMVTIALLESVLRPLVMGRGLSTPLVVILVGVIGGVISNGIPGLFLGPIILAVIWELFSAWIELPIATSDRPSVDVT